MAKTVGITGHTSGIGLAISKRLKEAGYEVKGYSRSTGHELPQSIPQIVREASQLDIFVNNAFVYHDSSQIALLYLLYEQWKDIDGKVIVNISSRAGDCVIRGVSDPYAIYKKALDTACLQLANISRPRCRVLNVKPGFVDTPSVASIAVRKLQPVDVANAVLWMISQPEHVYATSLSLRPLD